jgi:hypothetical protein
MIAEAAMTWLMGRTALFTEGSRIVTSRDIKYRASYGFPTKQAIAAVDTRYREAIPPVKRLGKNAARLEWHSYDLAVARQVAPGWEIKQLDAVERHRV